MNIKILIRSLFLASAFLGSITANAGGIPTFDTIHNGTSLAILMKEGMQYAKQLEEYKTQLDQYQQQMKDAAAPALYVWDQAQATINKVRGLTGMLDGYVNKYGNIERYLSQFKDLNYWRDSACYKGGGCSEQELQEMHDAIAFGSESQNESNSDFMRLLNQQQDALNDDAETLEKLQEQASGADGHMKALQAANQLASAQAAQVLQLRSGFNAFANAVIQRQQALQQVEAMQKAAADEFHGDKTVITESGRNFMEMLQ